MSQSRLPDLQARLGTTPAGLTSAEAARRLAEYGPNRMAAGRPVSAWRILAAQFRGAVVMLLLAAAMVAWVVGDHVEAIAILAILFINAAIGFVTEYRARGAMAALLSLDVPVATVIRDGAIHSIPAADLVPGDLITLEAGQKVPADARLVEATELRVDEAPLTGESLPVSKSVVDEPGELPLADRVHMVYMSTTVVHGTARALVVATGSRTEVGRIGTLVGSVRQERTPLEIRLDALGHQLIGATLAVTAVVVLVGLWRGEPLGRMVETGLALAIAAVPEGLAAVSTIALAVGVARMARRQVLVRRLPAVEALGSTTTICTDKTGTLTAGEMTVTAVEADGARWTVTGEGYRPVGELVVEGDATAGHDLLLRRLIEAGTLANDAGLDQEEGEWIIRGDPTEVALLVVGRKMGIERAELIRQHPLTGSLPFSSERMVMATFHSDGSGVRVAAKGAPGRLLARCDRIMTATGVVSLDHTRREAVLQRNREMGAAGLRVLAVAEGDLQTGEVDRLIFLGLVGISDPPAEGVAGTVRRFREAGIRTIMVTGDQRTTAQAVALQLGLLDSADDGVVEGRELEGLDADALRARLRGVAVLSRVTPEQKLRVVEELRRDGEIVAMLGDGVNDAPALKRADIGVAMGRRGTDVAKEAASIVLQDDRFRTIASAVEEGRVIFDNIRKFVFYLFSCNVAEVMVILGASLLALPQPLLPLQILWLNLVTDTFPALSLAVEPAEEEVMLRPPRDPAEAILSRRFLARVGWFSLLITAATIAAFLVVLRRPGVEVERAMTVAFVTLALAQVFHLGNARSSHSVLSWRGMTSNRWAVAAVVVTTALQLLAVYWEPLAGVLGTVPLDAADWLVVLPASLAPAVVGQVHAALAGGEWRRTEPTSSLP